ALWPGKPTGISVSVEEILGMRHLGLTVAATFVGEAYMSGGMLAVFLTGCCFGFLARWWGDVANTFASETGVFVYAFGFFAIVIAMRSITWLTVAILPPMAGIAAAVFIARKSRPRAAVKNPAAAWKVAVG